MRSIPRLLLLAGLATALACGGGAPAPGDGSSPAAASPPPAVRGDVAPEAAAGSRTWFQFVDDGGSVRFVARLEDVPPQWRDRAGRVELAEPPPARPADRLARRQAAARATADRVARSEVVLYYASWCGFCRKTKAYLEDRNVRYRLADVDQPAVMAELERKTGSRAIPVLEVGGQRVRGFDRPRIDALLAAR